MIALVLGLCLVNAPCTLDQTLDKHAYHEVRDMKRCLEIEETLKAKFGPPEASGMITLCVSDFTPKEGDPVTDFDSPELFDL